jgi:hypothetical protein
MRRLFKVASILGIAAIAPHLIVGQTPGNDAIPVVTVCDVLKDLGRYNGKSVIVVGRRSGTMEGDWLSADCERKLVTDGFTWPDDISLAYVRNQTEPPPPLPDRFKWDTKLVAAKLKEIQRTTKLRPRPENDRWFAIFGRLETRLPLQAVRCGSKGELCGYGFGHLNTSPAQLIWPEDRRAYRLLR